VVTQPQPLTFGDAADTFSCIWNNLETIAKKIVEWRGR
jgi:hypothetical protein